MPVLGSVDLVQFRQYLAEVEAEADDVFTAMPPAYLRVGMTHYLFRDAVHRQSLPVNLRQVAQFLDIDLIVRL